MSKVNGCNILHWWDQDNINSLSIAINARIRLFVPIINGDDNKIKLKK